MKLEDYLAAEGIKDLSEEETSKLVSAKVSPKIYNQYDTLLSNLFYLQSSSVLKKTIQILF